MKALISKIHFPLLILTILNIYLPTRYFAIIIDLVLGVYLLLATKIRMGKENWYIVVIYSIGIFGMLNSDWRSFGRDVLTYFTPLAIWGVSEIIVSSKKDVPLTLVISGTSFAGIDIINKLVNIDKLFSGSIGTIRTDLGYTSLGTVLALAIIIYFYDRFKIMRLTKICIIVLIISIVISFSRTNYLAVLLLVGPLMISKPNHKTIKRVVLFLVIGIAIVILFGKIPQLQPVFSSVINKIMRSFTEVSSNGAWNDVLDIQRNWRGYEAYCAMEEFKNGSIIQQVFGFGFGKLIYAGDYAVTLGVNDSPYLPRLHNGYYTLLIKCGLVGISLYLLYFIALLKKGNRIISKTERRFSVGIVLIFIIFTYFSIGLFILGGMFFELQLMFIYLLRNGGKKSEGNCIISTTIS